MDIVNFGAPGEHWLSKPIDDLIYYKWRRAPRSLQEELGPSEIGEPCTRKLALNLMNEPALHEPDPLPSVVGTAAHSWMEDACRKWNDQAGRVIWIPELEIPIAPGIPGHCDAYHVPSDTVVDWKFPGTESMKHYRKDGPSVLYRKQAHLYGWGWVKLGMPVKHVAIVFFPRGGQLHGKYGKVIWSEPYDPTVAEEALKRYFNTVELCVTLDVEHHPERYKLFAIDKGHHCTYCPWLKPGEDTGNGCPGWTADD